MEERLRKFAYLVDAGSFTKAAQQLHISQPALSTAIGKLERELKSELLVHGATPLQLTPAGEAAYETARRLQAQTKHLADTLAELAGEKPFVALGMIDSLAAGLLATPATLDELETQAKISIVVNNSPYLLQAVEQQRVDIALIVHQPTAQALTTKRLGTEPLVLVCHPALRTRVQDYWRAGDLQQFISYEEQSTTYGIVREELQRHGVSPSAAFYATSPEVMVQLVRLQKGVAALPLQLVGDLVATGEVSLVGAKEPIVIERPIDVAYRPDRKPIAPISAIISQLRRHLDTLMDEARQL